MATLPLFSATRPRRLVAPLSVGPQARKNGEYLLLKTLRSAMQKDANRAQTFTRAGIEEWVCAGEENVMTHANLRLKIQGPYIVVTMRGTCLRARFRKQDAPWLAMEGYEEDSEALITFSEFRT